MMLPMLMAGTPTWIFLSERDCENPVAGANKLAIKSNAKQNRRVFIFQTSVADTAFLGI
jgi:hypothetical protein